MSVDRRAPTRLAGALTLAAGALLLAPRPACALLELRFSTPPALPSLPALTLNARPQTTSAAMTSFAVEDTRLTKSGWNVTVQGQSATGKSAVFAQYCPKANRRKRPARRRRNVDRERVLGRQPVARDDDGDARAAERRGLPRQRPVDRLDRSVSAVEKEASTARG